MVSPMEPTFLFKIMTGKTINYLNCFRYVFCRKIVVSALLFFIVGVQHAWAWSYVETSDNTNLGKWTQDVGGDGGVKIKNNENLPSGTGFLPAFEVWRGAASGNLTNGKITHSTISAVPNGRYRLSFDYIAISGNGNDPAGAYFDINGDTGSRLTSFGSSGLDGTSKWRQGTLVKDIMITNGKLDFSIVLEGANFNWIVFKNLKLEGWKDFRYFEHYKGIVSEMGTAPEGLKTDYKTSTDDPRLESGVTLQRAHEYTHDIYLLPGQTYDLEPFSDFHTRTEYQDAYHRWYDYTTDGTSSRLFIAGKSYATDYFYFDNIPARYAPRGFVLHDNTNGTVSDGAGDLNGSRKHKFADGGNLVHVIYLCSRGDGTGYATYGEDDETDKQLSLQPGKYRISFSYTGWQNNKPQFNFKFYKSGNESSALLNDNLTPTSCHYEDGHANADAVFDEDNYSQVVTITEGGNYIMKWSVAAGWSGIAFGNIKLQALSITELEDSEGNKKGYFGGSAVDGERTSASIATYTAPNSTDEIFDVIAIDVANALPDDHYTQGATYTTLKEPTLQYRHIFVIHNAKTKTDELNEQSDPAKNYTNVIRMMCPEGTPFQYRLENFEYRGWGNSAKPTGFYHKTGDNTYEPVYHYRVEIREGTKTGGSYTYNTIVGSTAGNRSYDASGNVIGTHSKTAVSSSFNDAEETLCNNMKDDLVYTYKCTNGYDAALYLKKPTVGHYQIRVYAINANSADSYTDIKTYDSTTHGYTSNTLILQEIELEVLPKGQANMVDEATMNADDFAYKYQRPKNMQAEYGEPTTVVNFDDIKPEDVVADSNGDGYYKWPWQWELSSYGFGYDKRYDYNMYVVANRSKVTPWKFNDNIYDRLYADTNGEEKGFFLYANAATDPTRMVVLNIGNNLCIGSRIYVSAWINEFNTYPETANVVFAFKGVKKDGTEVILNNYVTGYVPGGCNTKDGFDNIPNQANWEDKSHTDPDYRNKWMHVYYYFDPQFDEFSGASNSFDHFIISLENNCTGSSGADYAIDDIRAFVCKPELKAFQDKPVCNGDPATKIEFVADFDRLLSATGTPESTEPDGAICYYAVIDKTVYEKTYQEKLEEYKAYADKYNMAHKDAYLTAVVKGIYYNDGLGTATDEYGWYEFDPYFVGNKLFSELNEEEQKTVTSREVSGVNRYLHFPSYSNLNDTKIHYGTSYWIILSHSKDVRDDDYWTHFDPYDQCSARSEFKVIFSGEIKVDGKLSDLEGAQNICANQRPKIEIDLNGIRQGGEPYKAEDAYFDWYFGPLYDPDPLTTGSEDKDHYYYNEEYGEQDLFQSLVEFRSVYPEADEENIEDCEVTTKFTQAMKDCLLHFLEEGRIALRKQTQFASTYDEFNEPLSSNVKKEILLTAIPINPTPDSTTIEYCLDAFQVRIPISTRMPHLKNGDDKGLVPYPTRMRDVPLRIGLRELKKCSTLNELTDTGYKFLYMPLRDVTPVTDNVTQVKKADDDLVYLVASNDPNVKAGLSGARRVATYPDGTTPMEEDTIYYIGKVSDIVAQKWKRGTDTNPGNVCHIAFLNDFKFREGYWYTIKFNFVEDYDATSDENYDVCPGDVICTIKVVPEYQMWTGAVDGNWNNEGNWRRVTKDELLNPETIGDEYITDGTTETNDNEECFVPADFTKVIIPANPTRVPVLYDLRNADNLQGVDYVGGIGETDFIRYMTDDDEDRSTDDTNDSDKNGYWEYVGAASDTINFDMASVVLSSGNVACRSWYDHTCDEIHFMSGAQIINQQYLHYNKAWADIEITPDRWYTMSLPLTNVVAGDFYLPTDGARQSTPLFEDITYDTDLNDRFKPAVYQRTWNASNAKLYKLGVADPVNAATGISLDWSHVYNDVLVNYSAGSGCSVKADVSGVTDFPTDGKVLFRFPKADTQYVYYNPNDDDGGTGKRKTDNVPTALLDDAGKRTYRLASIQTDGTFSQTVGEYSKADSKYFLVGNPFMCSIDMDKFFAKNTTLAKKYWILTEEGQRVAVADERVDGFIGTTSDNKLTEPIVAPFQSFFVALADNSAPGTITPVFTTEMMVQPTLPADPDPSGEPTDPGSSAKTRAAAVSPSLLCFTATDSYNHKSVMMLTDGSQHKTEGAEALFDSNLADEPMVYATVHGQAMTIGSINKGDTIPVGLTGADNDIRLNITGATDFQIPLYIYDAETDTTSPLDGDITLSQSGNGVRYYLISPKQASDSTTEQPLSAPVLKSEGKSVTVTAPAEAELTDLRIVTTGGMNVTNVANAGSEYSTELAEGIYIITLRCNNASYTYKVAIW